MPFVAMIAGPNGSGKTTLVNHLRRRGVYLGEYVNPDEIAAGLSGAYDERVREAQHIAERRRSEYLRSGTSFTFETVMSHPSKVEFFAEAAAMGFDTILYFVATSDPELNVLRVAQRVAMGGHDVPADRIVSRYHRTMAALPAALKVASRAFLFDNSGPEGLVLAAFTGDLDETGATDRGIRVQPDAPEWVRDAVASRVRPGRRST